MNSSSNPVRRPTVIRPMRRESDRIRSSVQSATFDNQLTDIFGKAEAAEPTWAEGYEAGVEEGMSIGRALTSEEEAANDRRVRVLCDAIALAADRAISQQQLILEATRDSLLRAAFDLTEALIDRELRERPRSGEEALRAAISLAPEHLSCTARLNPTDLEQLTDIEGRFSHRDLTLVADHSIPVGDCVVDLPAGQIEFCLADALDRARRMLLSPETASLPERSERSEQPDQPEQPAPDERDRLSEAS